MADDLKLAKLHSYEQILELLGQAYCTERNQNKVLDPDLCVDMGKLIFMWHKEQLSKAREAGRLEERERAIEIIKKYFFDRAHEYDADKEEMQRDLMLYHSEKIAEAIKEKQEGVG